MRYLIPLAFALVAGSPVAEETTHYCRDPEVNRQWQKAREDYPGDALVLRLAALRESLCSQLAGGVLGLDKAQELWQQGLTDALLERAREEQRERGLLRLFATF